MLAYHNDPAIKAALLARLKDDFEHDRIIKGQYWQDGKGCAVGCTVRGRDHGQYPIQYGIPAEIAYLEDRIFEGLSNAEAQQFPLAFAEAIPVGADLSRVVGRFLVWLLIDPERGVIRHTPPGDHATVLTVAAIWEEFVRTGRIDKDRADAAAVRAATAYADATAYAADATRSAAYAAYAVHAAAYASTTTVHAAAYAATAAARAAGEEYFTACAAKLLELLRAAK